MFTRREFGTAALAGLSAAVLPGTRPGASAKAVLDSTINGVGVGAISYCFRAIPRPASGDYVDTLIEAFTECGIGLAEITANHVEPEPSLPMGGRVPATPTPEYLTRREEVRRWRLSTPLDRFREIRTKFDTAGIRLLSYAITLSDDATDEELDRIFQQAVALGVGIIGTNQTRVPVGRRAAPLAAKYGISLGFHNHTMVNDSSEIASIESFEAVMAMSPHYRANLDIGHFTAANLDAVAFIRRYHDRITHLHLKDRKRDSGPNMPWGEGDTPLREVLQLVRRERYPIPCIIEYEHKGQASPVDEVKACLGFIRKVLA
jgi:sugar phosphate isomerase/epimerase